MQAFEKLGAFYLGRRFDPRERKPTNELLLYDSRDLTTHAVCLGMTGSGKTGLCISLLEEAAIDGIPAIAIDLKGDIANLMLAFPKLRPEDFRPWIDPARSEELSPEQASVTTANRWREGLASWGQDGERIARFCGAAERAIYTPGSNAGIPLALLRSFEAPPPAIREDGEALQDRIQAAASSLLALAGVDMDAFRSREYTLIANLLDRAWRAGRDIALDQIIREIQSPPFERLGALDLESFYPRADRAKLVVRLNSLLASPSFASWMEGEPLDIGALLHTPSGTPRLSIVSIAHLDAAERMFFVTTLLDAVVAWMRTQPGTGSLRALLYMDEVFGYFPPTAEPPSKRPMLTLLKQARAYGLGVVLATQNPVDLDYKGLSNAGTWFLGRLQTERDKERVLDGLEGVTASTGAAFDRRALEATLSGLSSRVFLLNNVHEKQPVLFHTRWAMSYLPGPLTRTQIATLMADRVSQPDAVPPPPAEALPEEPSHSETAPRPAEDVLVRYGAIDQPSSSVHFRPAYWATTQLHYANARLGIDLWRPIAALQLLDVASDTVDWTQARLIDDPPKLEHESRVAGSYAPLPRWMTRKAKLRVVQRQLKSHLYQTCTLQLWRCRQHKLRSEVGEDEAAFRVRLSLTVRERRDAELEKLRARYAPKIERAETRILSAQQRIGREEAQLSSAKTSTALSVGATVLGALFGRKLASATNVRSAASSARSAGRVRREAGDVQRAREKLEAAEEKLAQLEARLEQDLERLRNKLDPSELVIEPLPIRPRKSDIALDSPTLLWTPWTRTAENALESLSTLLP